MDEIKNNQSQNHNHSTDHCGCGVCTHKDCGSCNCGKNKMLVMKYPVLRWILGIVIIFLVLWLGMKIGEFKAFCESGYHMGSYRQVQFGDFSPMMR